MAELILSLCDYSGVWSQPYVDAGYEVVRVDIKHPLGEWKQRDGSWHVGADLNRFDFPWTPYATLAAPSCTCFCRPGARWWPRQDAEGRTSEDVILFRNCLRLCRTSAGWWALENPPGRHRELMPELPQPAWQFHPCDYGDPWTKQTYIWGTATKPAPNPVDPVPTRRTPNGKTQGRIAFMSSSHKHRREETPPGFARSFFEANA